MRTMTESELLKAVEERRIVIFDGIKGVLIGYQVITEGIDSKIYSAGIRGITGKKCLYWVPIRKVKLTDEVKG